MAKSRSAKCYGCGEVYPDEKLRGHVNSCWLAKEYDRRRASGERNLRTPLEQRCEFCGKRCVLKEYPSHLAYDCTSFRHNINRYLPKDDSDFIYMTHELEYLAAELIRIPSLKSKALKKSLHSHLIKYLFERFKDKLMESPLEQPSIRVNTSDDDAFHSAYQGGLPGNGKRR